MSIRTFAALLALLPSVGLAQQSDPAEAAMLFRRLQGRWSCAGGFPNGRKLEADLNWKADAGERVLRFSHVDRAPSTYWQDATWVLDTKAGRVIDFSASGSTANTAATPALFVATQWSMTGIALVADTLKSPPWTPNRFTFSMKDSESLLMRWEVGRTGTWTLGDSLVCARK